MTSPHDAMADELRRVTEERDALRGRHAPIPALPGEKGRGYFCKDSDGQWHYLNHGRTWQTCPPPFADAVTAEIPAALLLAHKGDMAAAVRALQERIGRALTQLQKIDSPNLRVDMAEAILRGDTDA